MKRVTQNAYKQYLKSRPVASSESNKRTKDLALKEIGYHPLFGTVLFTNFTLKRHEFKAKYIERPPVNCGY